ncbi:cation diffusion facilitator family transporter, partial [uncultured Streptococcus sp.]|uniref:cation diffusion facilitator family transporter n=1 Tax=uncultured Streptococcus sp. TaxID=83427 RepID=UPI00258B74C2
KTAYDIFMESAFSLSDGFDQKELKKYKEAILKLPKVSNVKSQRGRSYGSNIYLDIVVEMNPDLSVYESHEVTEQIEDILRKEFSVYDTDVHVEPGSIPEDETWDNVYRKLFKAEKIILAKIPDYEELISDNFKLVDADGQTYTKYEMVSRAKHYMSNFEGFEMTSISQKTKLITYELDGQTHTSIWRRKENWFLVFHQITPKSQE